MPADLQDQGDADVRTVDVMVKREGAVRLVRVTASDEIAALLRLLHEFEAHRPGTQAAAPAAEDVNNDAVALDPHPTG